MAFELVPKCYFTQDHLFDKFRQLRAIDQCPKCFELGGHCLVASHPESLVGDSLGTVIYVENKLYKIIKFVQMSTKKMAVYGIKVCALVKQWRDCL